MTKQEIQMEIKNLEQLIEGKFDNGLHGCIIMKHIKCGKESCKCQDGYKHGPYPHIQYYDINGTLRTLYIKKSLVDEYAAKLYDNNEFRKNVRKLVALYLNLREVS